MLRLLHCQNLMMLQTVTFEEYSCKGFRLINSFFVRSEHRVKVLLGTLMCRCCNSVHYYYYYFGVHKI